MIEHPTDDEIRLTQWFDGELSDDEISDLLAKDPELCRQKAEMEKIGDLVRLNAKSEEEICEPPFPELFNRQIQRRIQETPASQISGWLEAARDWFVGSQWAVPATAMLALSGILLSGTNIGSPSVNHSEVVHTFAPHPEHHATAEYLPLASSTVIRLEGLEEVKSGDSITGFFHNTSTPDQQIAAAVIYHQKGQPLVKPDTSGPAAALAQLASSQAR